MWKYLLLGEMKWLSGKKFLELCTFNYVDVCVSFPVALCGTVQWCAMYTRWNICIAQHSWEKVPTFTEHFEIGGFISSWVIATFNSGAMCISSPRKTYRRSPENLWVKLFSLWSCFTCKQHDIIFVSFEQNQHWYLYCPALISSSSFNKMLKTIERVVHSFQGHFWIHISFVNIIKLLSKSLIFLARALWTHFVLRHLNQIPTSHPYLKLTLQNISFPSASFFLAQNKTKIYWHLFVSWCTERFFFNFCC